jgi:AcrR family transcriptional regulator
VATQNERRANTQAALVTSARSLFGTVGFDNITIDELAAAAGVTRGALYHHYKSKEALFETVFRQVEEELLEAVRAAARSASEPRSALRAACKAYIRCAREPTIARIALIDGPTVLGWSAYRQIDESYFLSGLTDAVRATQSAQSARSTELIARALFAAVCELALQASRPDNLARDTDEVVDLLIRAL